jgi:3-oxo-5-alpha-steroid 4-dehydrogenase 1
MSQEFFSLVCYVWLAIALVTFATLFFRTAPYGRHTQGGWGPLINNRLGWILMESPAIFIMFYFWWWSCCNSLAALAFLFLWQLHYIYRALLYPFRLPNPSRMMPLSVFLMGAAFQLINGSLNGYWLFSLSETYDNSWITSPAFLFGAGLFLLGMAINHHADDVLLSLRQPGETGYKIPEGGLYQYISCPNYLGEIIEWLGWAIATWSLSGLTFALWTIANLAPRAMAHHRWYQEKFDDYPRERKALIPFIW